MQVKVECKHAFVLFFKKAPYLHSLHWQQVTYSTAAESFHCRKPFDFCLLGPEGNYNHYSRPSSSDGMVFINPSWNKLLQKVGRMYIAKMNCGCWQEGASLFGWFRRPEQSSAQKYAVLGTSMSQLLMGFWIAVCVWRGALTLNALCRGIFHLFFCPAPCPMCICSISRVVQAKLCFWLHVAINCMKAIP